MALAIWNSTITDQQGNVIPNARVEVRRESDGALVALYSDRNGTVGKGNPFNADGAGFVYFHCIGGAYRITATGAGQTQQWRYVPIGTAQELDAGAFSENAGWNAVENTPAGLANHTSAAAGYRVLVINADGNGRAAVYEKMGVGANWSAPIWITGVQGSNGPPNTLTIGTVTQTSTPQVTITGETPNQVLNFGLVKGDTGDVTPEAIAARDAAIAAKNSAESSAASATASASTATTKASEASTSASAAGASQTAAAASAATAVTNATNAGNSAAASLASANSATASASTATTKASEAYASADVAFTHRQAAAGSASSAAASATDADTAKTGAETARTQAASSATAASGSATAAGNSASAASGSASTATTQATNAGNSATAAAASASTANTAKTDAQASAVVASTKAGESASSATASAGSATTSATRAGESAVSATNSANSASAAAGSAVTATTKANEATTARDYAYQWSSAPQDTQVNDGTHTGFSAYHWSRVAETAAGGGILSVNGKTGSAITLDAADVGALATLVAGTNITITGGGDTRTINATVAAQVNSDWNATSGISQILNKPVLGTASAQNVSAFATAAQGVKADSALQTLTAGTNVTVVKSGTSYTINATSSPQVQSDWNATSGLGVILNKPTLGTAAAQNVGAFATAAQGTKADNAFPKPTGAAWQYVRGDGAVVDLNADTIGLGNVDNTSDANKPISTAQQTALNVKATYNWIINGDFNINQRGGVKKPANGVYGFDRWKGHASGIEQIIEALPAGEYTLTWSGGGSGTFGGQTKASPIKATVTGGNTSIVVPSSATKVSVVLGDAIQTDPWQSAVRSGGVELLLAQRYYEKSYEPSVPPGTITELGREYGSASGSGILRLTVIMKMNKRVVPTVTTYSPRTGASARVDVGEADRVVARFAASVRAFDLSADSVPANAYYGVQWAADAEFY